MRCALRPYVPRRNSVDAIEVASSRPKYPDPEPAIMSLADTLVLHV